MLNNAKATIIREWLIIIQSPRMILQAYLHPLLYFLLFIPSIAQSVGFVEVKDGIEVSYPLFVMPGIIIFNSFTSAQYAGIATYIDKLSGELEVLYSLPISRTSILIGKMFTAIVRTLLQSIVIFLLAYILSYTPVLSLQKYVFLTATAVVFSSILVLVFTGISAVITSQETFNIIVNLISLPLIFTSSIFYPVGNLPSITRILAMLNPLTYFTDFARQILFDIEINYWLIIIVIPTIVILLVCSTFALNRSLD